jgi:hypothetical protein
LIYLDCNICYKGGNIGDVKWKMDDACLAAKKENGKGLVGRVKQYQK